jgi:hypothetical protein
MSTPQLHAALWVWLLFIPIASLGVMAEATPAKVVRPGATVAASGPRCRFDKEAFTVLKLTTFEGGVRVDYESKDYIFHPYQKR